jgi:hypothetical protein
MQFAVMLHKAILLADSRDSVSANTSSLVYTVNYDVLKMHHKPVAAFPALIPPLALDHLHTT